MTARRQMTMRALVERNTASGSDDYGQPITPAYTVHGTFACRAWSEADRNLADGSKLALIEQIKAIFPRGADVAEGDEISAIQDRLGAEVFAGRMRIDTMQKRRGHKVASLEVIG